MSSLGVEITKSQLPDGFQELNQTQVDALTLIHERHGIDDITSDLNVSESKAYNILDGLKGDKEGIPKKWHVEKKYLEKIPRPFSAGTRYRLTPLSLQLISDDLPTKSRSRPEELPDSNKESSQGRIRPHYLLSKHDIRRGESEETWFLDYVDSSTDREYKQMPDGSIEEFTTVYYEGYEVEVFKKTVNIRIDFPSRKWSPNRLWRRYREKLQEVIQHVEDRFEIQLKSRPEHIDACMRGQHWAEVDSVFADWVWENRDEVQDDKDGVVFHVYDEDEDLMALVDASDGEPEFEWVHGQEARNHVSNMKDLIMWAGYYEITPKDFKSLKWLRENKGLFENVLSRLSDLEGLADGLEEVGERMDIAEAQIEGLVMDVRSVKGRVDSLETKVSQHDAQIEGLAKDKQMVREKVADNNERVKDAVQRVQAVQQHNRELEERMEKIVEGVESNHRAISQASETLVEVHQGHKGDMSSVSRAVESNAEMSMRAIQMGLNASEENQELERKEDVIVEELQTIRQEMEKGFLEKAVEKSISVKNRLMSLW